jgi:PTS system nitrogen regulatory IIA component
MYYSVPEAAGLLGVSEDLVYVWIRNEGLPANFYAGRYHLSRVKLIDWAHRNHFPLAVEGLVSSPVLESALKRGDVLFDVSADTFSAAISEILIKCENIDKKKVCGILEMLQTRDRFGWVIDEYGIGLPTPKSPIAILSESSRVYIAYLKEDSRAELPKVLFVILTSSPRTHLDLLSRCIFAVGDPKFRQLLEQRSRAEVLIDHMQAISVAPPPTQIDFESVE